MPDYILGPWQFGPLEYGVVRLDAIMLVVIGFVCAGIRTSLQKTDAAEAIATWIWTMLVLTLGVVVHEGSHAIAIILTGAGLTHITVWGISGECGFSNAMGPISMIIIYGSGLFGQVLFGGWLYNQDSRSRWAAAGLILETIYVHYVYHHNDFAIVTDHLRQIGWIQ